jgi:hypothetical protein
MNVGTWLKKQIRTDNDFRPVSQEAKAIQKDLDDLAGKVDELKKPVEVSLEGGFEGLSAGRKLMLGAAGGAAVGGVLGSAHGFLSPIGDKVELQVSWDTHPIHEDSLRVIPERSQISGLSSQVTSEGVIDVAVKGGIRYDFRSHIVQSQVGEYQTPTGVSMERSDSSNVTLSGLMGLGVGAGVGLVATGALMAVQKLRAEEDGASPPTDDNPLVTGREVKQMAALGAMGAVGGAGLGALSGWMEQNRASGLTQEVDWKTPVMKTSEIGTVPESASILIRHDLDYGDSLKNSQIYRDPSEFDLDKHMKDAAGRVVRGTTPERSLAGLGPIEMEEHSQTYEVKPNTTMLGAALGGALVGGVVGVAVGVGYTTLQRMIEA